MDNNEKQAINKNINFVESNTLFKISTVLVPATTKDEKTMTKIISQIFSDINDTSSLNTEPAA